MIHIAFAPDDNYIIPTSVALTSLFINEKAQIFIHLIYIEGNLSDRNRAILKDICIKFGQNIEFKEVKQESLSSFPKFRHGLSAYLRILTPYLLDNIDKILYLDGDIIVKQSILSLYNIDLSDFQLAAVSDLKPYFTPGYIETIGYSYKHPYINSGVLLMNLKTLRDMNILNKTKEYLGKYKELIYHEDQDILNCVCPDILILPPKYNSIIHLWNKNIVVCKKLWNDLEIKEAKENPVIIHYLGGLKPWKSEVYHPFKKEWYYYLRQSPFKTYNPTFSIKKIASYIKAYFLYKIKR